MKKIIIMLILPLFFIRCHLLSDPFEENINTFSRISRYNIATHETEILNDIPNCYKIKKLNNYDRYICTIGSNLYLTDSKFKDKKTL
ncbi:MAG: hypothetical protein CSB55_03240 [Candidatus Cloacimonadota bacterium]|nr:MAG: hypothetical protein CSB55_03240 [Candidatus Cloacimonadota bacterium]